jgi:hypothetical protein
MPVFLLLAQVLRPELFLALFAVYCYFRVSALMGDGDLDDAYGVAVNLGLLAMFAYFVFALRMGWIGLAVVSCLWLLL